MYSNSENLIVNRNIPESWLSSGQLIVKYWLLRRNELFIIIVANGSSLIRFKFDVYVQLYFLCLMESINNSHAKAAIAYFGL